LAENDPDRFFIVLRNTNGKLSGHLVTFDETSLDPEPKASESNKTDHSVLAGDPKTFADVFASFSSVIWTYRNYLQLTLFLAPMISGVIAERTIGEFAKSKGTIRNDLSDEERTVFELHINTWREFNSHQDEILAALRGAKLLPEVMLIGLVSAYDSFLANLLRVIFLRHEQIILTSEKTIKFSELSAFKSIDEARNVLIDREIESVLRDSHQEHFKWMENKFGIKLKSDLTAFPKFAEICERRNLLTHTGGIVSAKYIDNCREHGALLPGIELGTKLTVSNEYYSTAVDIICEIGIKLCYVLRRKFAKDERGTADQAMNEFCYDLIVRRKYGLAEAILSFSSQVFKKGGSDSCRRMMIINLANTIRLQKRQAEADKLLDSEDWSAVNDEFAISVTAVRGDMDGLVALMEKIGARGRPNAEDYRTWPVFRGMRSDAKFKAAFHSVFGEPVVMPQVVEVPTAAMETSIH
jgi:hypothetical protein